MRSPNVFDRVQLHAEEAPLPAGVIEKPEVADEGLRLLRLGATAAAPTARGLLQVHDGENRRTRRASAARYEGAHDLLVQSRKVARRNTYLSPRERRALEKARRCP